MRIERAVNYITTLGPGRRFCIWVNGCGRGCPGCVSERLQTPDPQTEVDIAGFLGNFNIENADGVTISGGEPFEQPEELKKLVEYLKGRGAEDILIYSGYTLNELRKMHSPYIDYVLGNIAVLIDGPYVKELDDGKGNLKGSSNQNIIFLKDEYIGKYAGFISTERQMEQMVLGNICLAVGIPDGEFIENFTKSEGKKDV